MRRFQARRVVLAVVLGLLVVTAGCSGGANHSGGDEAQVSGGGGGGDGGDAALDAEATATPGASQDDSGSDSLQVQQRAIIRTGEISVRVQGFDAAKRNLTRATTRYGGFVSDSQVEVNQVDNTTYKSGTLVLRVPRENFSEMMAHAKAIGELQSSSTQSIDVTDQLVDINARLKNLREERDRLRQLYENASDTEDILAVEERLSEVQGEIERLEARKKALKRQVAFSTIRVRLSEPRPDPGPLDTSRWYDTPILAAFLESVEGVFVTLRALTVAGAYVAPYLLVFGVPVAGLVYGIRRRRQQRDAHQALVPSLLKSRTATEEPEEPEKADEATTAAEDDTADEEVDTSDEEAAGTEPTEESGDAKDESEE